MTDIRYPVGPFVLNIPVPPEERPSHIDTLRHAPAHLRAAVAGLTDAQLDTTYRPGGWTLRQVVHHLTDAHVNWYIRPKLALTENHPVHRAL